MIESNAEGDPETYYTFTKAEIDDLRKHYKDRIAFLEGLLQQIEEHPHCDPNKNEHCCDENYGKYYKPPSWYIGCGAGHRCAAAIAARRHHE